MVFQNDILAGSSGGSSASSVYQIDQSIRYNEDDSPYIMRANPSDGSRTTFTVNLWFKVGDSGTPPNSSRTIFASGYANGSTTDMVIYMDSSFRIGGLIGYNGANASVKFTTTRQFRDHSAWYNLCFVADTTNNTQNDRLRLYINGVRETDFTSSVSYPNQNDTLGRWGLQNFHIAFGSSTGDSHANISQSTPRRFFDGYLAEIVYIDGTALEPSNFSETNSSGIWIPKDPSGLTFGTLGAYLKGETSSNFGTDSSGNNQNFTASGLASHDQVSDSPTNNFAVLNPLDERGSGTLSDGNLQMAFGATNDNVTGTFGMSLGKWYWEAHIVDKSDTYIGVQDSAISATGYTASAVALWSGSYIYENNSDTGDRSVSYDNGDVVGIAFDADNKKIWWSKNGQWYSADDSSANTTINISEVEAGNQAQVITRSPDFFMPFFGNYTHSTAIFNFGQEGTFAGNETAGGNSDGNGIGNFKYSVPSGYLALCTKNLGAE